MSVILNACSAIEAEDISDKELSTIMPSENDALTTNTVNFKWSKIEGVDNYQIQVVKPNFTNPMEFTIDSLVIENNISFTLSPGNYQWQVKAINNISETAFTNSISFQVDEVIDLTDQTMVLTSPQDNVYANNIQSNFTWEHLNAADSYLYQLVKGDEFSNTIIEQNTTINNFYLPTIQNVDDDVYTWKVKAVNSFSETSFSFRTLYLDTTLPNTPTLLSPDDVTTTTTEVDFTYNLGVDGGEIHAPITSILEISLTNDFTTLFDSVETTTNQINYTFSTTGTFYWRVKAYDQAGNTGLYSVIRQITVE